MKKYLYGFFMHFWRLIYANLKSLCLIYKATGNEEILVQENLYQSTTTQW